MDRPRGENLFDDEEEEGEVAVDEPGPSAQPVVPAETLPPPPPRPQATVEPSREKDREKERRKKSRSRSRSREKVRSLFCFTIVRV